MVFEFPFESVLLYRKRLEDMAHKEYLEAQALVDQCLKRIDSMYASIDQTRERIGVYQKKGSPDAIEEVRQMESYINGLNVKIHNERQEARRLMQAAESKHEKFIECAREHKILQKLRERRYNQYRRWRQKAETKRMNDLVTMRFRQGSKI